MNDVIVICNSLSLSLPSRHLPAQKVAIETLEQGVKYAQS